MLLLDDTQISLQLANIYITVTAGSLWTSLADILERPSQVLELLGESLPTVNGYFVSLLVTKMLAGLPIVFLRVGALCRMVFLRALFSKEKLTQRELDAVYRPDNVMYGWEVRPRSFAENGEASSLLPLLMLFSLFSCFSALARLVVAVSNTPAGNCNLLHVRL